MIKRRGGSVDAVVLPAAPRTARRPPALLCPLALLTSCLQATRGHDPRAVGIRVELEVVAKVVCRGTRWRRRAERLVLPSTLQRERVRRVKLCAGDRLVLDRNRS